MALQYFLLLSLFVTCVESRIDSTLIKTYTEADDYKTRIYSDGRDVVTALFDDKDRVVDCTYLRGNATLVMAVFQDAITKQTSHQLIEQTDVRLVGRACKRFTRKVLRWSPASPDPANFKEAKLRQKLHQGITGTSWCGLHGHRADRASEVEDPTTDRCCKELVSCNQTLATSAYQENHFNVYPWPIPHCNCTVKFHACLSASKGSVAKETGNLFFNILKLKCFVNEERDLCTEWDVWFTQCKVSKKTNFAVLKDTARF